MRRAALTLTVAALLAALTGCRHPIPVPSWPTHPPAAPSATTTPPTTTAETKPSHAPTITIMPDPTTDSPAQPAVTTTPPAATEPPAANTEAAVTLGWGKPTGEDEFDGTAVDTKLWGVYDGKGHGGNGRRSPTAFTVAAGVLTVTGDPAGTTGGMAYRDGQRTGRWETRMRTPAGDSEYHPVLLLWPDAEDWPAGGEVDYAELFSGDRQDVDFFLHYSTSNQQTHAGRKLDATQWHTYAVELSGVCVAGWIDGQRWFQDCNTSHQPPRAMHPTIQLDWFPDGSRVERSQMLIDWVRQYSL